jgi:ParB-like chromosome segregation protein Spo0J
VPQFDLVTEWFPVAELRTFHRNPRRGDPGVIAQSLTVNGQYKPIVVNRGTHTGRPLEVLAGNHTLIASRDLGWERIAGVTVDVDEDQAARIVAADNRTSDLAEYDERLLLELLAELPDLDGTGYDPGDLAELEKTLAELAPPAEFPAFDEDLETEHRCPKCGYEWSGKPA